MLTGKIRRRVIATTCILAAGLCASAEKLSREKLQRAIASAVFIRAERTYQGRHFSTSGSGFFVHPEGLVMTNWHVVADEVTTFIGGEERDVPAKVIKLRLVINSGADDERVLQAKVVALDRKRDLALIKARYQPQVYLDVQQSLPTPELADPVWIVGFPFGDILAFERQTSVEAEVNPEVSINSGLVTSLRRDAQGKLKTVQIDAAINPGNSGGPMLNQQGDVVGVAVAKIGAGERIGFAIAPNLVREFVYYKAARITYDPRLVFFPPQPIAVSVEPILADFSGGQGTVRLEGSDIDPVLVELTKVGNKWEGTIPVPEPKPDRTRAVNYLATVSFTDPGGSSLLARRTKLEAFSSQEFKPQLERSRDPVAVMADRHFFDDSLDIKDYNKSAPAGTAEKRRALSDVARGIKLNRDADGNLVLDNQSLLDMEDLAYDNQIPIDEANYKNLTLEPDRKFAIYYDRLTFIYNRINEKIILLKSRERFMSRKERYYAEDILEDAYDYLAVIEGEREVAAAQLEARTLCRCGKVWYFRHAAPCPEPLLALTSSK